MPKEPAVAFVEINNENALYSSWNWNHLDSLPEPYATTFRQQWNAWLKQKYGTTAQLAAAWNVGAKTLGAETTEKRLLQRTARQDVAAVSATIRHRSNGPSSLPTPPVSTSCELWSNAQAPSPGIPNSIKRA